MLKVVAIMTNAIAIANGNSGMVGVGEELLWVGVKEDPPLPPPPKRNWFDKLLIRIGLW